MEAELQATLLKDFAIKRSRETIKFRKEMWGQGRCVCVFKDERFQSCLLLMEMIQ